VKSILRIILCFLLFSPQVLAADFKPISSHQADHEIGDIYFQNTEGKSFILRPLHMVDRDLAINGWHRLFQNEQVYRYYERGVPKDLAQCTNLYDTKVSRFDNWKQDQLGWVAILDAEEKFQGHIGAFIKESTIEVCIVVSPDLQRTKVAMNGLFEYFSYFWQRLKPEVKEKITHVKSPLNPRNVSSKGLSERISASSVSDKCYTPTYYQGIAKEKGERVDSTIEINDVIAAVESYKTVKN
jgi:hypothetical protein